MQDQYTHDQKQEAFEKAKRYYLDKAKEVHPVNEKLCSWPYENYEIFYGDFDSSDSIFKAHKSGFFRELERLATPFQPLFLGSINHPRDVEYFKEYPAPLMELIHSAHYTNVNSTITFFGPMLYFLCRALGVEQVLEIGMAEGYTSWYLANAVKDNAVRYGMDGNMYYGVDILDRSDVVKPKLDYWDLPNTILQMDSINMTPDTFKDVKFDLIFQDGAHDTEHVVHEVEVLYPQLKGEGKGFLVCHDVYGPAEEGVREILNDKRYEWEFCRICEIYGIALLRKMEGYDPEKRYWVE